MRSRTQTVHEKDMATAGSFSYGEQFECPICTELFNDPFSLPCGHNFCKTCISRCWSNKELHQCPICKQQSNKSLKLCVNTLLRDIVENYKQDCALEDSEKSTSPADVLCDCCLHNRRRASKTCLVCLTTFCKSHLERHLKVEFLKTHTLIDPVPKPEEKLCTKHNGSLEETTDQTPVCVLCATIETREEKTAQSEKQDVKYIKINNSKKTKKTKIIKAALNKKKTEHETESLGDFYLYFEGQLYMFSPLPLSHSFSRGRVYYDVEIETNSIWELGVVSSKMRGKTFILPNPHSAWIVCLDRHCRCTEGCALDTVNIPERVFVCVDYEQGLMFIYHVSARKTIFCYTNCEFRGNLFLFFRQSHGRAPNKLKTKAQHTQEIPFSKVLFVCIAFVLLVFVTAKVLWFTSFSP